MPRSAQLAVAAASRWTGEDGIRYPGGDTRAWAECRHRGTGRIGVSRREVGSDAPVG